MNVLGMTRGSNAKWALYCMFTLLLAIGCSGDGGSSNESTSSTSEAVTFCDDEPLSYDLISTSGSTTVNGSGTFNGYIPTAISASPSASGFGAQVQLNVTSIFPPYGQITCTYAYTASGGQFITPTNTCVPPPDEACDTADCPELGAGYRFTGATDVSMTITRGTGSGELTGSGDFGDNPEDDGNPCTNDSCVGTSASHVALAAGSSCSDNNLCNGTETCSASATCVSSGNAPAGTPCPDSNICNGAEACNSSGVCVSPGNAPTGTPCPDGDVCDGAETCLSGSCIGGTALSVPASTTCTSSTCDADLGIVTTTSNTGVCAASFQPSGSATDPTVPTDFGASTSFLYTATSPIQTGVTVGDMVPAHAAVIRGRVLDTDGAAPLPGVTVKILNHPEFGQTLSRSDGYYDLAVNGGAGYVVDFELTGRLSSQRAVKTTWLDYSVVDDVILVPLDTTAPATVTNVTSSSQFTVGPSVSDDAGTRHANLYIPANTSVHGYVGSTYTLRATEFTQGPLGRLMMPGTLPPQSAYTYAVDFSIDTLSSAQFDFTDPATHVVSPGTVYGYVENYLSIPVGSDVPTGYYDNTNGQWITSPNGKVIVILNSSGDVNYTGAKTGGVYNNETSTALAAIGLSADERSTITTQYGSGAQLWRFPMQHFTPFDTNWGFSFPAGAAPPPSAPPIPPLPPDDPCLGNGSIIECQSQILAEEIPIFGTPYTLRYQSDRVPGRSAKITIPISGSTLPTTQPSRVDVQIDVAGRRTVVSTPTPLATNQSVTWTWDRLDAYGRFVQGTVSAAIKVSYVYTGVQGAQPTSFAGYPLDTLTFSENLEAREISFDREYRVDVGGFDARTLGFGGWSLSAEHVYDPKGVLYRGDGRRQTGKALSPIVQTIAGGGGMADSSGDGHAATAAQLRLSSGEDGVAVGPDGSVYIAEVNNHVIRKVDTTGTISHFAGIYNPGADVGTFTEGVTAPTSVPMQPAALSIGPDGALYVAETSGGFRVLKITLDSPPKVYLVAGHLDSTHNTSSFSGDLGLAKSATLETPRNVVVGPDRSVYIATGDRVRRVTPDGIIDTIVGDGGCNSTLSGPAAGIPTGTPPVPRVSLCNVEGIELGPDGTLYIATINGGSGHFRIRRLSPDGMVSFVAGNGTAPSTFAAVGDGASALSAEIEPQEIHFGPDGELYFANYVFEVVQRFSVGGSLQTFAGIGGSAGFSGDGGPATSAQFKQMYAFTFGPDGSMYVSDGGNARIRRVFFDGARSNVGLEVPSADGDEIYEFDSSGEHQATVSAMRGAARETLAYDTNRLLTTITDGDGKITTIARPSGQVTITGPYGSGSQETILNLDPNGYISSVVTPNGETYNMSHTSTGLLTSFQRPDGGTSTFTYAADGRLIHDTDALSGSSGQWLAQTVSGDSTGGYSVSLTTAQGLAKRFGMDFSVAPHPAVYPGTVIPVATQKELRTFLSPTGLQNKDQRLSDGSRLVSLADGTLTWTQFASDPRFGAEMKYVSGSTIKKGSTHFRVETALKAATLTNPTNPLSVSTMTTTDCVNGTMGPTTCTGGKKTVTIFTSSTNSEVTTLPSGRQTKRTFDPTTDRVLTSQSLGTSPVALNAVQYAYDDGRLHTVTVGTRTYEIDYDPTTGFVTQMTDNALGITTTNTAWDGDGRPTTTTLPNGTLGRRYDADGNLSSLTTPNTNIHGLISNAVDLLGGYDPPASGAVTTYNYDFDHNLAALLDPDGAMVYFRDPGGRVFSDGRTTSTYSSTTGQLLQTQAGTESRFYTYDGPLVSTITIASTATPAYSHVLTLGYDNFFHVTSRSLETGPPFSYGYDDGNLASAGVLNIARGTGSGYNSLPTGTTMTGFSFSETPTFDAYGALSNDAYGSVYSVAYTRDAGGRVTQKVETISGTPTTTTYVYDGDSACTTGAPNDGRLCQATIGSTVYGPYTYDADGNRTDTGLTYDEQDRISSTGYTYSPGGRLSSKTIVPDTATYTYDVYGNLTHVNRPYSLPAIDYINDSQNRRVGKIVGGTYVQGFLYDDLGRLSAELDGSGNVISQFVYGMKPNVPEYMINTVSGTTTTYRLITDQLGSVIMVVNAASPTGTPAQVITYDPWGKILTDVENISNGNPAVSVFQPFGFAGGLHDRDAGGSFTNDGGWVRFGARDYDTNTGRWTSKDPIRFGGGLDVYAYCGNNPIDCIDPNGRLPPGSVPWEPIFPPQPLWDPNACTDQCDAAYATATDSCRYWGESPFGDICPGLPEAPATKEGFAQECIDEAEFAWSSCLAQCHGDPYFPGVPIPGATPRPYIPQWASNGRP